jgi:hypothetical protein
MLLGVAIVATCFPGITYRAEHAYIADDQLKRGLDA